MSNASNARGGYCHQIWSTLLWSVCVRLVHFCDDGLPASNQPCRVCSDLNDTDQSTNLRSLQALCSLRSEGMACATLEFNIKGYKAGSRTLKCDFKRYGFPVLSSSCEFIPGKTIGLIILLGAMRGAFFSFDLASRDPFRAIFETHCRPVFQFWSTTMIKRILEMHSIFCPVFSP